MTKQFEMFRRYIVNERFTEKHLQDDTVNIIVNTLIKEGEVCSMTAWNILNNIDLSTPKVFIDYHEGGITTRELIDELRIYNKIISLVKKEVRKLKK